MTPNREQSGRQPLVPQSQPAPVPPSRGQRRTRWEAVLLGVLVSFWLLAWFQPWVPREIPEEVVGVWFTDDATFQGRALELQARALVFRGAQTGPQAVHRVHREPIGALIRYKIDYEAAGGLATLSFTYAPGPDVLKLENRPGIVWRRTGRSRLG